MSVRGCCWCALWPTCVQDKDLFREHYCVLLSRRLLLQKSSSNFAEVATIGRLKAQFGPQYTRRIEDMIADLTLAEDAKKVLPWFYHRFRSRVLHAASQPC